MKKQILLIILLASCVLLAENYRKVNITISSRSEIIELQKIGFPLDDAYQNRDGSIDMFLNEQEFKSLSQTSIQYNVLIEDWADYYAEQRENNSNSFILSKNSSQYNIQGFSYGSMGGFYTLDEVWSKIDEMVSNYPNLISVKDSIGASYENRPIYAVRISDNPNVNEDEPEVLYTALHHAREPESMMQMMYFMFYLLENYGTDAEATYLVDNREMYFIPVVNPDGYYYNQTTDPNGGGNWRKNRRPNADSTTYGVDLNRNYGFEWGYDNLGSSGVSSSLTYRGAGPFSEPETETIRQYCINHDFKLALNYHSYSNLLITPWGYIPEPTPDSIFYFEIASDMTQYNNYRWGYSAEIIYAVNGDSDDWFYGEQTEKNKIYAMTPEVGNGNDNFWPTEDRIIPLAEENVYPNLYLAWVAGGFANTEEIIFSDEYFLPEDSGSISIAIKNKGLENLSDIEIKVASSANVEILEGDYFAIGNMDSQTSYTLSDVIKFRISDDALSGDSAHFEIGYYYGSSLMYTDTKSLIIGHPKTYFLDSLFTLENWNYESNVDKNWELTNSEFYSSSSSITDSRVGNYLPNSIVSLVTKNKIDLSNTNKPLLKFKTKYSIESDWDYGQISISTDSTNWEPIGGENSKLGSGEFQPIDTLIYDGFQRDWINEVIDLSKYSGEKIFLKFELVTDEYTEEDGWYIDDVEIFEYTNQIVSVNDKIELPTEFSLSQNYPNPFNPSTIIKYSIPAIKGRNVSKLQNVTLKIYDILGREVSTIVNKGQSAGNYEVTFEAKNITSGIYFYKLQSGDFIKSMKMMFIK
jgi:carboxypeptidase T